jgi:hypothetical protein
MILIFRYTTRLNLNFFMFLWGKNALKQMAVHSSKARYEHILA